MNANRIDRLMDLPLLTLSKTFYDGHHAYLSDNNRILMDVLFWIRYSQTTSPMSDALHHQIQSLSLMMKRIKLLGFKLATMKYAHKLSTMYESQPLAITSKEWRKITESLMPVLPAVNVVEQSPSGVINHKKRKILASRKQLYYDALWV